MGNKQSLNSRSHNKCSCNGDDLELILGKYNNDPKRLMDVLIHIQTQCGCISDLAVKDIAEAFNMSKVDVVQTISFYHFLSQEPRGEYTVYLNDSAVAKMKGRDKIAQVFEKVAGTKFGSVSKDGKIGLFNTSCIGMNDQEPSAIINRRVFTNLTEVDVERIVKSMKEGLDVNDIKGRDPVPNILLKGPILKNEGNITDALKKAISISPDEVIEEVKQSKLRGRGGAGFPTALKWRTCRDTKSEKRYIFCNADEGEPGTFKDRVILTERPRLLFTGMTIAGYAVGSDEGILYLRFEYKFMEQYLENILSKMRKDGSLGKNILGKKGFNFDIRIQFGGGAYVCGEESALLESAEGKRGEPRDKPPYPVVKGYLQHPTVVNNVETLCCVARIIQKGVKWYCSVGTKDSTGSKLLSISGDCKRPGVYEIACGTTINDVNKMVGAEDVQAVQVGGPSGVCVAPIDFDHKLAYEDLATGGSIIIIGNKRDLLKDIVLNFTEFFLEESCGSCVPCRAMTNQYKKKLEKIIRGNGVAKDLEQMLSWEKVMKANRCGLGQTAANPITCSIRNFRELYESKLKTATDFVSEFDLEAAVQEYCKTANRIPNLGGDHE